MFQLDLVLLYVLMHFTAFSFYLLPTRQFLFPFPHITFTLLISFSLNSHPTHSPHHSESLKRKENIIQTLHITRDVVVQSRLVLLSVKITELVYSHPSP